MEAAELLQAALVAVPGSSAREKCDRPAISVPAASLPAALLQLRDDERLAFDMLLAHTAVDWIIESVFELVYQLTSLRHGHHLMVCAKVPRAEPVAPSVSHVFRIAEWQEREVYDMFGVLYENHPDLRRLLLEDSWEGHPLRKDYVDDHMLELPK